MTHSQAAPGFRPLAALAAVVALVHMLVLQTAPLDAGRLGTEAEPGDAAAKTFATRSIEALAAPEAAPAPPPAAAAPVARQTPKIKPNRPLAPKYQAQVAPDLIADQALASTAAAVASAPAQATPAFDLTPQNTAAATSTPLQAVPTTAASAAASLPAGLQATPVTAISLPGSARLKYKVVGLSKSLNYQATAELIWKASSDKYEALLQVSAFLVGSRSMTSVGQITATGLAPTRFADKGRNELAAHFDAAKGKIIFSANTPDAPLLEGAQDRVSVFLQLGGILAARPADFTAGASVTLYTVGPREAEPWTFIVEAEESLDLLGAPMQTLKLTRKPRRDFDQKVEVWYAPMLGYLPVRNRITQASGDFVDQQLSEVGRS